MKARLLLVALATTVAPAAPASAAIPSCLVFRSLAPYRYDQPGVDLVKANLAASNHCGAVFTITMTLHSEVCSGLSCGYGQRRMDIHSSGPANPDDGWEIAIACEAPKRNYFLQWSVQDGAGNHLGAGATHVNEVRCDNSPPPVNNPIPCEKLGDVCRAIDPD